MLKKRGIPRRDYVVLPAVCVATVLLLIGIPELIAQRRFYEQTLESCTRPDPVLGQRALPNCQAHYKSAEGPWLEMDYNECGYRSNESCLTKPADTFRVALIGSSTSMGYLVPYEQTFAVRTEKLLTAQCGRTVEFQSMGGIGYQWGRMEVRMDEALTLQPDLVIATLSPFDLRQPLDPDIVTATKPQSRVARLSDTIRNLVQDSALWKAVVYYRAQLPVTYLRFFLRNPSRSDYLQRSITPFWQQQLGYTQTLIDKLAAKARAANVPLMLIFVPLRSQAVLLKHHAQFPDQDPLAIDRAVQAIAARDDVKFMDFTPTLAAAPDINPLYFALYDHVTGEGSVLLADQLSRDIAAARYPGLTNCSPIRAASVAG